MTKKDIAKLVAESLNLKQADVLLIMDKTFEYIVNSLAKGNDVMISKFGKFRIRKTKKKTARNPKTGETVSVDDGYKILFKVSDLLKEYLNKLPK